MFIGRRGERSESKQTLCAAPADPPVGSAGYSNEQNTMSK